MDFDGDYGGEEYGGEYGGAYEGEYPEEETGTTFIEEEEEGAEEEGEELPVVEIPAGHVEPVVVGRSMMRRTSPYMSKYEKARIIGTRALQISANAPIMVEPRGETNPLRIAEMEMKAKKLPLIIRRNLPDGTYEDWLVSELTIL